jgi:hypothetical protein
MKSKKKVPYAKRKKAFDTVLEAYRSAKDLTGGLGAITISDTGKPAKNFVKPTLSDFRCDVVKVFTKILTQDNVLAFYKAYIEFDSTDTIEMEMHADKLIGSGRHNLEQGMGAEFIKRGIYPTTGKGGYFKTIRQPRGKV